MYKFFFNTLFIKLELMYYILYIGLNAKMQIDDYENILDNLCIYVKI